MTDPVKRKYKRNYLTQVIYQIVYNPTDLINEEGVKKFKSLLGQGYSTLETVRQAGVIIQNDGTDIKTTAENGVLWQIEGEKKDRVLQINQRNFSIVFSKYTNFKEYESTIDKVQNAFNEAFPEINIFNRLGLRYVNQIRPNDPKPDWSEYFNDSLVDSLKFVDTNTIRRSMHNLIVEQDNETFVSLNYGEFNQFFPSPIIDREFIIDIDAFTPNPIEKAEVKRLVEKFNKVLAIYFEKSIKNKLREVMEEIKNAEK